MSELLKIMASCDAVDEQSSVKFPPSTVKPTDGIFKAGLSSLTNKLEKASKHLSSAFGKVRKNIFPSKFINIILEFIILKTLKDFFISTDL